MNIKKYPASILGFLEKNKANSEAWRHPIDELYKAE